MPEEDISRLTELARQGEIPIGQVIEFYEDELDKERFGRRFSREINNHDIALEGRIATILDTVSHRFDASEALLYFRDADELQDNRGMAPERIHSVVYSDSASDIFEGREDEVTTGSHGAVKKAAFALNIPENSESIDDRTGMLYLGKRKEGAYSERDLDSIRDLIPDIENSLSSALNRGEKDNLTGLLRREYFDRSFKTTIASSLRANRPLSLLMIDLDHFKAINDTYGHLAGDHVLKEVGNLISSLGRSGDIAGRYGGEELTKALPNTDEQGAMKVAEKIQQGIRDMDLPYFYEFVRVADEQGNPIVEKTYGEIAESKEFEEGRIHIQPATPEEYRNDRTSLVKRQVSEEYAVKRAEKLGLPVSGDDQPVGKQKVTASIGVVSYPNINSDVAAEVKATMDQYKKGTDVHEAVIKNAGGQPYLINNAIIHTLFGKDELREAYFKSIGNTKLPKDMSKNDQIEFFRLAMIYSVDKALYRGKSSGRDCIVQNR